jgi:H+/Cl- antiporter ClcA
VIAIFINTFVNPIALEAIHWKYYIVFIIILALLFITVYFFYPETRGHTLEQMAVIFDGPNGDADDVPPRPTALSGKTGVVHMVTPVDGAEGEV